ncbi:MAG: hypothetical protein HYR94_09780 [Chloroflexi bacterium]|nr:hypothetical protein [Chloroflexota bacterium]
MPKLQTTLDKLLDTFFHLPTLVVIAVIAGAALWQLYDFGLNLDHTFIRLSSNRGSITLHWTDGCCELDW